MIYRGGGDGLWREALEEKRSRSKRGSSVFIRVAMRQQPQMHPVRSIRSSKEKLCSGVKGTRERREICGWNVPKTRLVLGRTQVVMK